jgi:hypothetical protein
VVLRYTKAGNPFRLPPYSKAELEEMRVPFDDPFICYFSHRRSAQPPQDQEPPELPLADIRPEREQS